MSLDFSAIDKISAQASAPPETRTPEAGVQTSFLQAGYTVVESPENPFTAPQTSAPAKSQPEPPEPQEAASEGKEEAFTDHTGSRDYNRLYRIAHEYHRKHSPPVVDREYWRTHTPGIDDTPEAENQYWIEAAQELGEASVSGLNDPFLMGLLCALYAELEREYKTLREEAHRSA